MRRRRPLILLTAAFLLAAGLLFGPPLLRKQVRIAATGAPPPIAQLSTIEARPGQVVCASRILLSPRTAEAVFSTQGPTQTRPPLEVTADGPGGYRSGPVRIDPARTTEPVLKAPITPPDRELLGRLCIRNAGDTAVRLMGSDEFRTRTRLETTVDGEPNPIDLTLSFYTAEPVSVVSELGGIVHRMTIARGFLGAEWLVWIVLLLAFAGVPAAMLWTVSRVIGTDR